MYRRRIPSQDIEVDWLASPYTFDSNEEEYSPSLLRDDSDVITARSTRIDSIMFGQDSLNLDHIQEIFGKSSATYEDVIISKPPYCHLADVDQNHRMSRMRFRLRAEEPDLESEDEEEEEDDGFDLVESATIFEAPAVFPSMKIPAAHDVFSEANKKDAKEGAKILDNITRKPFNKCWAYFTEIYPILLYFTNLVVTLMSTIGNPHPMTFKIPYVILSFLENIILWAVAGVFFFKEKTDKNEKHKQYIENITHELLIYPVIIVTVIAFSTEKGYSTPTSAMQWIGLLLLIFDVFDLLKTTLNRLYMTYRAIMDIRKVLFPTQPVFCNWHLYGGFLPRLLFTIVGNSLLFFVLIVMLAAQVNTDNPVAGEGYLLTWRSGILVINLVLLPVMSILLFAVASSYWIFELLVRINMTASAKSIGQGSDQDGAFKNMVLFAADKAKDNATQFDEMKSLSSWKKIFYGLSKFRFIAVFLVWQVMVIACYCSFQGFQNELYTNIILYSFIGLSIMANYHSVVLAIVADLMVPLAIASIVFYPCSLLCCFRKKSRIREEA